MRCASISVGIVDYAHQHYRESEMRLRHAAEDARAFSRYAALAGSDESEQGPLHRLLVDRDATPAGLSAAFSDLAAAGPVDVFFLYLSGHGEQGDIDGGWFCLADAQPARRSLAGTRLDELLRPVQANYVFVIIDCCYAEAAVSGMTFFSELGGRSARLLVASARRDQRSWEDDGLRRSLFSDVLLRALSTDSPIATAAGYVDVEAGLFPHLREQVPLIASSRKRGYVQEPVMGGLSSTELRLPTVASRSLGRRLTTAQAIKAGVRRILVGAAAGVVAILLFLDLLVFHLAVDGIGEILVRPGLQFSFGLQPFHPVAAVDTGFRISDIDPQNSAFLRTLADGTSWGFRTHVGEDGLRPWLGTLQPALIRRTQLSTRVLARGEKVAFNVDDDAPPVAEGNFLSRLTGIPVDEVGRELYPQARRVGISCDQDPARSLDFSLISAEPEVFRQDALWATVTAPADAVTRASFLLDLVKLDAYRFFHRKDGKERLAEFAAFAAAVEAMTTPGPSLEAIRASIKQQWPNLQNTWCYLPGTFALAMTGDVASSRLAELGLWATFETYRRDVQGDLATSEQSLAAEGLARLARRRPLDATKMEGLAAGIETDGADLTANIPTHALAWEIATVQSLPERLLAYLVRKVGPPKGEFDFDPLGAAKVLACNAHFLDASTRAVVKDWLEKHATDNRTMSDFHEALGCAGLEWSLTTEQTAILEAQLSPASRFPPRATNYRGETVISATGDAATLALGKVAQRSTLRPPLVDQLASFAASRTDLKWRYEILAGLAHQWYGESDDGAGSIYRRLASAMSDFVQRNLEIEVAAARLNRISLFQRQAVVTELLRLWRDETEPELRLAIAHLIGTPSSAGADTPLTE